MRSILSFVYQSGMSALFYCFQLAPPPDWSTPDVTFYLGLSLGDNDVHNLPKMNNITFRTPPRPFLLQEANPIDRIETCELENSKNGTRYFEICGEGHCECSHVINVALNQVCLLKASL